MTDKYDPTIEDNDTRRLIYEHLKDAPERQLVDTNDLDAKAATLFAAASVVMGLASFGNLGAGSTGRIAGAVTTLLILAAMAFAVTAAAALLHLRPVDHSRTVYAKTLSADFRDKPAPELQEWLIRQVGRAWEFNEPINKRKAKTLEWIVVGLGLEVLLVVAALIVSRF
jgi:hypothetical protein